MSKRDDELDWFHGVDYDDEDWQWRHAHSSMGYEPMTLAELQVELNAYFGDDDLDTDIDVDLSIELEDLEFDEDRDELLTSERYVLELATEWLADAVDDDDRGKVLDFMDHRFDAYNDRRRTAGLSWSAAMRRDMLLD